jgi:hypothetical protein
LTVLHLAKASIKTLVPLQWLHVCSIIMIITLIIAPTAGFRTVPFPAPTA